MSAAIDKIICAIRKKHPATKLPTKSKQETKQIQIVEFASESFCSAKYSKMLSIFVHGQIYFLIASSILRFIIFFCEEIHFFTFFHKTLPFFVGE